MKKTILIFSLEKCLATIKLHKIFICLLALTLFPGLQALAATWYVTPTGAGSQTGVNWDNAFSNIQDAIDAAASTGDEIWVAGGTYTISAGISLNKTVQIFGGFSGIETSRVDRDWQANETTIDGRTNEVGCFSISSFGPNSTIDGLTIKGYAEGNSGGGIFIAFTTATIANCTFLNNFASDSGGAIYISNATVTIINCNFLSNVSDAGLGGGAIFIESSSPVTISDCNFSLNDNNDAAGGAIYIQNSSPVITNCQFSNNNSRTGGGSVYNNGSSPTITNCTFTGNSTGAGEGAAIYNDHSSPEITNCNFSSNDADENGGAIYNDSSSPNIMYCNFSANSTEARGGAICNVNSSSPTINACVFSNNIGYGGGGGAIYNNNSSPVITSSIFSANDGRDDGGAIYNLNSAPFITNCSFSKNIAATTTGQGGAIFNNGSSPTITNSILWGNIASNGPEIFNYSTAVPIVTYCDVQGGYPGAGNIDENPLFVDAVNNNFHLMASSLCIDAGTNSAPNLPSTDIDGDPRIINSIVEIGADEFVVSDPTPPDPPIVIGDTPTNEPAPTWSWTSGGGGNGTYRYQLNSQAGTWQTTSDIFFTPSGVLSDGPHILYVQENDDSGNWSSSGSFTILVDTIAPTTSGHVPVDNQPNVAVNSDIVVHILDSGSGVDSDSIVMTVTEDGVAVSGSVDTNGTPAPSDYTVTFDPSYPFGNLASIEVTVSASDLAGNPMTDPYDFETANVGSTSWDAADGDGDGIPNSEEDLLGTSATTRTIFIRPKTWDVVLDDWVYWSDFVEVLFPPSLPRAGFADIFAFSDAGIEVVVIGAETDYLPMRDFSYDPGNAAQNPVDFDPATVGWQGPHCDILEIEYYPKESREYCKTVGGCHKNFGHVYFNDDRDEYRWDTKGFTPNTVEHHNYYKPAIYGFAQHNYFYEAWFAQLAKGQPPVYLIADPWPADYLCNWSADDVENDCYDFKPIYTSPLNLNKISPSSGSPDDWVEFKPVTFDAEKKIDCFDDDCTLTEPLAVTETQFGFSAVLRRTIMHEMGHAFLLAIPDDDHCDNDTCILQVGVEDWTLHPFGTTCGHKAEIQGAVHNSRH